jgi:hypothetical protein
MLRNNPAKNEGRTGRPISGAARVKCPVAMMQPRRRPRVADPQLVGDPAAGKGEQVDQ